MRNWSAVAALLIAYQAQSAEPARINGTVLDRSTQQPVADAKVILRYRTSPAHVQTTASSTNGTYRFEVESAGQYAVEAEAPGYVPTEYKPSEPFAKIEEDANTGDVVPSAHELNVSLTRGATITGRLKDGDTLKPVAGKAIRLWQMNWHRGQRVFTERYIVFTGDDGAFQIEPLAPGDYFIEINLLPRAYVFLAGIKPEYSAEFPRPKAYPNLFWPSTNPETGTPFTIQNEGETDIGDLVVSKVPLGSITVHTGGVDCREYGFLMSAARKFGWNTSRWNNSGDRASHPAIGWASARVEGVDIDVDLAVRADVRMAGTIECECAEGWREKVFGTRVRLEPLAFGILTSYPDSTVDEKGNFTAGGGFSGIAQLVLVPSPPGFVIRRILYNGLEVGPIFLPDPYTASQSLRIVLSDRPASIEGIVRKDLDAQPGARVAVAKWPLQVDENGFPLATVTSAGEDGHFSIDSLAAGTYKAVAVDSAEWFRSNLPGVLAGWLSEGLEFNLGEDDRKQIITQLTKP